MDLYTVEAHTFRKERFCITFTDRHTRYRKSYLMKSHSELGDTLAAYMRFCRSTAHLHSGRLPRFHGDGEFIKGSFSTAARKLGLPEPTSSAPRSPHQNGIAERSGRTIMTMVRAMLYDSGLPKSFWGYAYLHATWLCNRIGRRDFKHVTPHELFFGTKPSIGPALPFGHIVSVHVEYQTGTSAGGTRGATRRKLDPRARFGIFVGVPQHMSDSVIEVYFPRGKHRIHTRSFKPVQRYDLLNLGLNTMQLLARFNAELGHDPPASPSTTERLAKLLMPIYRRASHGGDGSNDAPAANNDATGHDDAPATEADHPGTSGGNARPQRQRSARQQTWAEEYASHANMASKAPGAYKDIADLPESEQIKWRDSMQDHMDGHAKHGTFEAVDRSEVPDGHSITRGKWVHVIKRCGRYKSRFVGCGYTQRAGIDFLPHKVSSSVCRWPSIRVILALAATYGLDITTADISNAFLNADMDCELYVEMPEGFNDEVGRDGKRRVYRVRKCLFGFKQSNRLWDDLFAEHLTTKMGFVQSISDPCVYTLHKDGHTIIMATWTDDLIIASSSKAFRDKFIAKLAQKFDLRDQGAATDILGAELTRAQDGSLKLSMGMRYLRGTAKSGCT